jgi:hypothetical protein
VSDHKVESSNLTPTPHSLQSDDLMICAIVIGLGPSQPSDWQPSDSQMLRTIKNSIFCYGNFLTETRITSIVPLSLTRIVYVRIA